MMKDGMGRDGQGRRGGVVVFLGLTGRSWKKGRRCVPRMDVTMMLVEGLLGAVFV